MIEAVEVNCSKLKNCFVSVVLALMQCFKGFCICSQSYESVVAFFPSSFPASQNRELHQQVYDCIMRFSHPAYHHEYMTLESILHFFQGGAVVEAAVAVQEAVAVQKVAGVVEVAGGKEGDMIMEIERILVEMKKCISANQSV